MNYRQFATSLENFLEPLNRDQKKFIETIRLQSQYDETMEAMEIEQTSCGKNAFRAYWITGTVYTIIKSKNIVGGAYALPERKTILVKQRPLNTEAGETMVDLFLAVRPYQTEL